MSDSQRPKSRFGFTLIEILCVVMIFAIAAAIVFGEMSSQGNLQAESGGGEVMADLLAPAQNQAGDCHRLSRVRLLQYGRQGLQPVSTVGHNAHQSDQPARLFHKLVG